MWFKYKDIDFDYDEKYVTEEFIKNFFDKAIDLSKKVEIFEITVENTDFAMIYIEKTGKPDEWDYETINFYKLLTNEGYDVLYADEDYGEGLDVLLIYNDEK